MPLFEYECDACGRRFEVIQKNSTSSPDSCRHCGKGPVHRLFSSPAIQFKGSGWYVTDYAQKGKTDSSSATPSATGDAAKTESSGSAPDTGSAGKSDSTPASPAPSSNAPPPPSKDSKE